MSEADSTSNRRWGDSRSPTDNLGRQPGWTRAWRSRCTSEWVCEGKIMPRIADAFLDCVFYLYPDDVAAEDGERAGGSGFLIGIPAKEPGTNNDVANWWHIYAITNAHVIDANNCTIRLNDQSGKKILYPTSKTEWRLHPDGDDVAICPISDLSQAVYKFNFVPFSAFLTNEIMTQWAIGLGDDCFMVGRFINHEGRQRNLPSVRFGNIGQMPHEKIRQKFRKFDQESFLVECRAIGGYSGSPVFVYVSQTDIRPSERRMLGNLYPMLLGVEWGVLSKWEPVCDVVGKPVGRPPENLQEDTNSGMMGVVPVWKISDILNMQDWIDERIKSDEMAWKNKAQPPEATPTSRNRGIKVSEC